MNRTYFKISIEKCLNQTINDNCASNEAIEKVVNDIVFTMYYLQDFVEFNKLDNLGKSPIKTIDEFHS